MWTGKLCLTINTSLWEKNRACLSSKEGEIGSMGTLKSSGRVIYFIFENLLFPTGNVIRILQQDFVPLSYLIRNLDRTVSITLFWLGPLGINFQIWLSLFWLSPYHSYPHYTLVLVTYTTYYQLSWNYITYYHVC